VTITLVNNGPTSASLTCKADGASYYSWEKQGNHTSYAIGVKNNILTLTKLQPKDAGNYRCVATNSGGVSSKSNYASLTINGMPNLRMYNVSCTLHMYICSYV